MPIFGLRSSAGMSAPNPKRTLGLMNAANSLAFNRNNAVPSVTAGLGTIDQDQSSEHEATIPVGARRTVPAGERAPLHCEKGAVARDSID